MFGSVFVTTTKAKKVEDWQRVSAQRRWQRQVGSGQRLRYVTSGLCRYVFTSRVHFTCSLHVFTSRVYFLLLMKLRPMPLSTSSMSHTGAAHATTSIHSLTSRGTMLKMVLNAGMYRISAWSPKDIIIATMSQGLIHGGMTMREMSSLRALHALNISITTSVVSDSVLALILPSLKYSHAFLPVKSYDTPPAVNLDPLNSLGLHLAQSPQCLSWSNVTGVCPSWDRSMPMNSVCVNQMANTPTVAAPTYRPTTR
mmetsp:Transcript_8292/g.20949  ORF Transcript_8292/g.20949 Transcript_8292/m.20949 type:complete len:254 (+) Transcript_8292:214-975(+)